MWWIRAPRGAVLLISFLAIPWSSAWASSRQPSLAYGPSHAAAIVHGLVSSITSCAANDQSSAWTFVELQVIDTLAGHLVPAPGQSATRHTVRFKLGEYANGTVGGFAGTPRLVPGDEVVLLLERSGTPGQPALVPINLAGDGLYRIFQLGGGATAVVDGAGLLVLTTASGEPVLGPKIEHGEANFPPGNPVNRPAAVTDILDAQSYSVTFGDAPLRGTWKLAARFSVHNPVQITTGSGTYVPDIDGRCTADLFGAYDGQQLHATGTCLGPYVGDINVDLTGHVVAGRWRGQISVSSDHPQEQQVTFQWASPPIVAADADRLTGTITQILGATPPAPSNLSLIQPIANEIGLIGAWVGGIRPVMTKQAFLDWLQTTAADAGNPGASVDSTPMNAARCNQLIPAKPAIVGGSQ